MSDISDEYIYEVTTKIASQHGITEWSLTRISFETMGQNYFGVLMPLTLQGKQDGKYLTLHLVLKLAPLNEAYRVSGAVTVMFAREIFVYSELLHKYSELQVNLDAQNHYVMPRCYFVCKEYCKEVIAMQNMCADGYSPFTKQRFLDFDHVTVALKSLAKFHALSFILKDNDQKTYEAATKICLPLTNKSNPRFMTILIDRLEKALHTFQDTSYVQLLEVLKSNFHYFMESARFRMKNMCICHGDIWKENILFKYKDNMPISACIIDYQTARMTSPAYDVLYLIITSMDTSLRQCFRDLIDMYYETFTQYLLNSNLDPKHFYSKEDLEHDLEILGPACFIVANTAIWLSSGLQEEGHVRSRYQPSTEEEKMNAIIEYKTIIQGIIDDLNYYGLLEITKLFNK